MFSLNYWDVSCMVHQDRLAHAKYNYLIGELRSSRTPLMGARKLLSRILFFL